MIDKISIRPDRVYLKRDVVEGITTVLGFKRNKPVVGKDRPRSATFQIVVSGEYPIITVVANLTERNEWLVKSISFCLGSLLYGHNAQVIKSSWELALALTRLREFVAPLLKDDHCLGRVIPGTETNSRAFLLKAEIMFQFADEDHRFLRATHFATRPRQQVTSIIQFGGYTRIPGKEIGIRVYDKIRKYRDAARSMRGIQSTRAEVVLQTPERLAKFYECIIDADFKSCEPVMKTISIEDGYAAWRNELLSLSGFGPVLDSRSSIRSMHPTAKKIVYGLGRKMADPNEVSRALDEYKRIENPCSKTFRAVSKSLRSAIVQKLFPSVMSVLPENLDELRPIGIERKEVENEYAKLLIAFRCSDQPDADILEAWTKTTYLTDKPKFTEGFRQKTRGIAPQFGPKN